MEIDFICKKTVPFSLMTYLLYRKKKQKKGDIYYIKLYMNKVDKRVHSCYIIATYENNWTEIFVFLLLLR